MAGAGGIPPMLRLKRSAQSGSKAMATDWTAVYTESSVMAYLFLGGWFDLSTMALGDIIEIRVQKQLSAGGALTNHDLKTYNDVQPPGHQVAYISPLPDVFGIEISMRQTLGVLKAIPAEMFDAMRLGIA